ncbi:MAG: NADH-quinone oxidoreductase subunit NuoF [Chitinispirillaceae bacterium]|nr:NADH-quinone oxidoreductase subunit NuoF [Chitinispirillaceae bacterium]
MSKLKSPGELEALRHEIQSKRGAKQMITVCSGTGCLACGAVELTAAFIREIEKKELAHKVEVRPTGCHGFCERGPIVVILPQKICYLRASVEDVAEIVEKTLIKGELVDRLLYEDPETGKRIRYVDDIPFYKHQQRILLAGNVLIDPTNIWDYLAVGGYAALAKALFESTPEEIIDIVKESGLRGRGGGGFPTGVKWETTRNASAKPKYAIVNADEGDPGAYMDRSLLEGNPHGIIEGLIIGAYAIGANEGFIYVRREYPLACKNTRIAIEQAREYGFLGTDILGSGFDFDISVHHGAGAFVSGESSALMNAIEGRVGEPRPKYVHTSVKGLWDKPSCLNNVETWANIPFIVTKGAGWFKRMGTPGSTGTKIFSLVGKVNNTGLVEVPMGMSIRDIIFKIGAGIPGNKKFKAVQTGGPSGGVLPEKLLDLPVDFDELTKAGSMMGSGGMIVMDEDTCMVDTARYYIDFLAHESCGKCVPCREGLRQMLKILNRITRGEGTMEDIGLLEELCSVIKVASLCGLGQSSVNPVMSVLKYFGKEVEAHVKDKRCPAGVCKNLIAFHIDPEKCKGCGLCAKNCPANAITKTADKVHVIDQDLCIKCGLCISVCPEKFRAVEKVPAFQFQNAV